MRRRGVERVEVRERDREQTSKKVGHAGAY